MPKGPFIFDSHALLKFFQKEKEYKKVVQLLEETKNTKTAKYINAMNLGEILYSTKREFGDQKKMEVLANIERLNFTILPVPNELVFQAAGYKAQYNVLCRLLCPCLRRGGVGAAAGHKIIVHEKCYEGADNGKRDQSPGVHAVPKGAPQAKGLLL